MSGIVLVLNGASSSGKTTLARALQQQWERPLLHLGTDTMIAMLPQAFVGMGGSAREGFEFVREGSREEPVARVRRGPVARALEAALARAVRVLAEEHDVVLDLVLDDPPGLRAWALALDAERSWFVGVRCAPAALAARELARGDRFAGLWRSQHRAVHEIAGGYDLEVDTTSAAPAEVARTIVAHVRGGARPDALARIADAEGALPEGR